MRNRGKFWENIDANKHTALTRAKNHARLVWFAIFYLSVTTTFYFALIAAIALGKATLPDRWVNSLMAITVAIRWRSDPALQGNV